MTNICLLLSLPAYTNWYLHQIDINTSFLHGDLEEYVYIKVSPSLKFPSNNLVCKLNRSIYGLRQPTRQWNQNLTSTLINLDYIQFMSDYSLFTKKSPDCFTIVLVYVDDLLIASTHMTTISHLKRVLNTKFNIKDLGNIKYFLGFEVAHSSKGITICQRKYILDVLEEVGLL